jgi:copper oxidase (laccase) domain-containing protein
VDKTVKYLISEYKVNPKDLVAGIGPSIGPCHYQVGSEVVHAIRTEFPDFYQELLIKRDGSTHLDLWKTNELQLRQNQVGSIEVAEICTACHVDTWYSHRAEKGKTGRFSAAIYLQESDR